MQQSTQTISSRMSLKKRFGRISLSEFKRFVYRFQSAFSEQCRGSVSVEIKLYSSIPSRITNPLLTPILAKEEREDNEELAFESLGSIRDLEADLFSEVAHISVSVRPDDAQEVESAWGVVSTSSRTPSVVNFYIQPSEEFAEKVWLSLRDFAGWNTAIGDR